MKLSVIICSYNEKNTILEVVRRVQQVDLGSEWTKEIIIVDNNSTDGTRTLLQNIKDTNVQVVLQPKTLAKVLQSEPQYPYVPGIIPLYRMLTLNIIPVNFPSFSKKH